MHEKKGKKWLKSLPFIVEELAKRWDLTELKPMPNLSFNYVLEGKKDSKDVILKVSIDDRIISNEKNALLALSGYGVPEILKEAENAILLEKLSPGTSLKTYLFDRKREALEIACQLTYKLHQAPLPSNIKLSSIEERFKPLDNDWPINSDYLALARKFRDHIFKHYKERKVLHGDLHHDNIIKDQEQWKAIDPHGVIGFAINEVWSFIVDVKEDIPYVSNFFNFNLEDLKKCYFLHTILTSIWCIEDNLDPSRFLDKSSQIQPLL